MEWLIFALGLVGGYSINRYIHLQSSRSGEDRHNELIGRFDRLAKENAELKTIIVKGEPITVERDESGRETKFSSASYSVELSPLDWVIRADEDDPGLIKPPRTSE